MKRSGRVFLLVLFAATSLRAEVESVPLPPMEGLEEAVRETLTAARAALLAGIELPETESSELAALYGNTGMVFNAHHSFEVAEICYRNAVHLAPEVDQWPYLLGFLYQDTGRFEEAVSSYRQVLELTPDDPLASLRLGESLLNLNRILEAEAPLLLASRVEGLQAAAFAGLGKIEMSKGSLENAVDHYRRAIQLQPTATQLYYPLSLALRKLDRVDEAREQIALGGRSKVQARDDRLGRVGSLTVSSEMFMTSGARAIKAGRLDQAATSFRGAIAARPENARAHLNLAVVLRQMGNLESAEKSARTALEYQPDYFFAHFNLGEILESLGRVGEAKEEYELALTIDPGHIKANQKNAALKMRERDFAGAVVHYEVVIDRAPSLVAPRYLLALAWVGRGEVGRARTIIEQALEVHAEEPQLLEASVRLIAIDPNATVGEVELALNVALKQQEELPTFSGAEALAMILAAAGRFEQAVTIQKRLIEQLPDSASVAVVDFFARNLQYYSREVRAVKAWP